MVISVQCPSCATTFPVDTRKVPPDGVYARCSVCSGVFLVEHPPVLAAAPLADPHPEAGEVSETWGSAMAEAGAQLHEASDGPATVEGSSPSEPQPDWSFDPASEASSFAGGTPIEVDRPEGRGPDTSSTPGFTFGRRDPHEKARRLARVLVSDMIMYNPERHSHAIAAKSLREDFEEEIRKSWEEYVEQVGEEIARGTSYFDDALNDILAGGERVFP